MSVKFSVRDDKSLEHYKQRGARVEMLEEPREGCIAIAYLYEGCVFDLRERNGYHDSDFYAVVWDEGEQCIKNYEYDTTRYAGGGWANVDATEEVRRKADEWLVNWAYRNNKLADERQAKAVERGKLVRVVAGRKVPTGTEGKVFWMQDMNFDPYGRRHGRRTKIGLTLDGEKETVDAVSRGGKAYKAERYKNVVWTYADNVEVVNPEQYLSSDEELWEAAQRVRGHYNMPSQHYAARAGMIVM